VFAGGAQFDFFKGLERPPALAEPNKDFETPKKAIGFHFLRSTMYYLSYGFVIMVKYHKICKKGFAEVYNLQIGNGQASTHERVKMIIIIKTQNCEIF
jgi:hypothetical protein